MAATKFIDLLPARPSYGRGAGYEFQVPTGLLTVTTNRRDRRYRLSAIPGGWRVEKLDAGTDPAETHYHVEAGSYRCDCRGHARYGHCCHADCVRDLDAAGLLEHAHERPAEPPVTEADVDAMALAEAARWELLADECWLPDAE